MTRGVLGLRDELVITLIHEGLQAIFESARQLVCRTRPQEATVLDRGLQAAAPVGTSARDLLADHGTSGVVIYSITDPFFVRGWEARRPACPHPAAREDTHIAHGQRSVC